MFWLTQKNNYPIFCPCRLKSFKTLEIENFLIFEGRAMMKRANPRPMKATNH